MVSLEGIREQKSYRLLFDQLFQSIVVFPKEMVGCVADYAITLRFFVTLHCL